MKIVTAIKCFYKNVLYQLAKKYCFDGIIIVTFGGTKIQQNFFENKKI